MILDNNYYLDNELNDNLFKILASNDSNLKKIKITLCVSKYRIENDYLYSYLFATHYLFKK